MMGMEKNNMKIAIFTDAFYPQINGIVTSIFNMVENLTQRGHSILIVAPAYRGLKEYSHPGVTVHRVPSLPASFYDDFRWTCPVNHKILSLLRDENVDVVHFMTPVFVSLLGIKYARKLGIPVVGTFHTFIADPLYYEKLFTGPVKVTDEIAWRYLNLFYDAADYVSSPTPEAVKMIRQNGCTAPLEALSNGIDMELFDSIHRDEMKEKYGLGEKVVLFVGRISYEKNLGALIDSFDLVFRNNPEAQLLIVGDGPQRELYEEYASGKGCHDRVIFTGVMSYKELLSSGLYSLGSLFVTASETETQGLTMLEAMANRLISMGPPAGGIIDLIEDGVNGYFIDPASPMDMAEKISYALNHREDLKGMEEKALESMSKHDMKHVIDRWESIYKELHARSDGKKKVQTLRFRSLLKFACSIKLDFTYLREKLNIRRLRYLFR